VLLRPYSPQTTAPVHSIRYIPTDIALAQESLSRLSAAARYRQDLKAKMAPTRPKPGAFNDCLSSSFVLRFICASGLCARDYCCQRACHEQFVLTHSTPSAAFPDRDDHCLARGSQNVLSSCTLGDDSVATTISKVMRADFIYFSQPPHLASSSRRPGLY
jgi:hypothetical protein